MSYNKWYERYRYSTNEELEPPIWCWFACTPLDPLWWIYQFTKRRK